MMTTDISYIGMAVGMALLAVPVWIFYKLGLARQIGSTLTAVARMVLQLFLTGLYLRYLFEWNSPWVNVLWVLLMVAVASFTVSRRTRLRMRLIVLPLLAGLSGAALAVGLYFLLFVLNLPHPFDSRYFIPVMGILTGNMLGVCVMGLNTFYDGLQRERQFFLYMLGNGASHAEAIKPFVRRAIEKSLAPCIANIAVMGIVSLPETVIGQILGGTAPGIAVKYQMMLAVIIFSASMLALLTTLFFADRRSFDAYGRLRDVRIRK